MRSSPFPQPVVGEVYRLRRRWWVQKTGVLSGYGDDVECDRGLCIIALVPIHLYQGRPRRTWMIEGTILHDHPIYNDDIMSVLERVG